MRRRIGAYLPIVLFAIVMQLFAPIGATWAAASAYSDPLGFAPICSPSSGQSDDGSSGSTTPHSPCCPLCVLAHAGSTAPTPVVAPFVALHLSWQRVVWLAETPVASERGGASTTQARGPPSQS
ncbi:MAG: DUF2946 domain-containing protein [Bradyrhizobiaceae bacterium]|nr:MAG: DUF2946 domain-containing protein [Bradyrhizobiaceae bacterium]